MFYFTAMIVQCLCLCAGVCVNVLSAKKESITFHVVLYGYVCIVFVFVCRCLCQCVVCR